MKVIDISWPLSSGTTGYKDKGIAEADWLKTFEVDHVRETVIRLKSHTGTHVDAPSHFLRDGHTIDQMPLGKLIGKAHVLDMTFVTSGITHQDLVRFESVIAEGDIILFKTTNSSKSPMEQFDYNFIYLEASGAQYLAQKKIKAVGIDYLGIERAQPGHETHTVLMEHGIPIVEGLRLGKVAAGNYFFCCLPLALVGLEAAPARAILLEDLG